QARRREPAGRRPRPGRPDLPEDRRGQARDQAAGGIEMRTWIAIALACAAPALARAQQDQPAQQNPQLYTMPPPPPLTLDPSGQTPIYPGAPPNPYAPPGSGRVPGTQQPAYTPPAAPPPVAPGSRPASQPASSRTGSAVRRTPAPGSATRAGSPTSTSSRRATRC